MSKKPKRVREQVVAYLEPRDRALLEDLAAQTGLSRTELLRRGLWSLAAQGMATQRPGSAFEHLIATAAGSTGPTDVSARADHYLYGGGYAAPRAAKRSAKSAATRKRARPR